MASKEKLPNIFKRILERISKKLLVKFPKNNRKKFKLVAEELCFGVEWTFQKKKKKVVEEVSKSVFIQTFICKTGKKYCQFKKSNHFSRELSKMFPTNE